MKHEVIEGLIKEWQQEAAKLERENKKEWNECQFFQTKGEVRRLRLCAIRLRSILNEATVTARSPGKPSE